MKGAFGKEIAAVVIVLLISMPAVFSLAPEPPSIFIDADPPSQDVQIGSSSTFKVTVYPQGDWKSGEVALALINPPPNGVTLTLSPEKMTDVQLEGFTSEVTVKIAADVPQGKITLQIQATGVAIAKSNGKSEPLESSTSTVLNIVASTGKTNTTTTATTTNTTTTTTITNSSSTAGSTATVTSFITSTLTTTSTSTVTIISTERTQPQSAGATGLKPETNGYMMFGVGALAVSSVLFVSGVLLLVSNRKHS